MKISDIILKMTAFYNGSLHDIEHFMKVYAYAKTIGELEGLSPAEQYILEASAAVHDIACPLCRKKYGAALGAYQEQESEALLKEFFSGSDMDGDALREIIHIVSHHHSYDNVDSRAYRILLEADYLVNASEAAYGRAQIENAKDTVFRTATGLEMLNMIYLKGEN